ncbi:hypothetical protein F5887DRAFT_943646 [Amanita rubescens]|nr:hypothetical protein F5887DRAFT_943646 [Amanita rubescens]
MTSPLQDLSELELRQLYDNEEAERFLHIFSTYVTEVRVPDDARRKGKYGNTPLESNDTGGTQSNGTEKATAVSSLSEAVAMNIIVPLLPPGPNPRPDFTLSRLRLTVQRLYMALEPIYRPFVVDMIHLATWSKRRRSLKYCLVFWILWWFNLLLPSLILRILYSLIRRRIFSYPSYVELQEHRKRVKRATEIGDDLSTRLVSTTFDLRDLWKLYKHVKPTIRDGRQKAKSTSNIPDVNPGSQSSDEDGEHLLDAKSDSDILHVLNSIADFHERVINLFIWRDPASSRIYRLPQYLTKLLCFFLGFTFWHVVPVMKALPPSDRARLPVPLASIPTDAEFAMQVISKRVADGDELRPAPASRRSFERSERSTDTHTPSDPRQADVGNLIESDNRIDWSKWGSRLATGKAWVHRTKQLISTKEIAGRPEPSYSTPERSHSYPAQYRSSTGILTITPDALYFVPASSSKASLEIPLHALRAVKKSDTMAVKGLILRWMDVEPSNGEKEERLGWVGGRDELFARLVGRNGGRWLKV